MKRFILDFFLVILLVMLGSSFKNTYSLNDEINQFDDEIMNGNETTNNKVTIFIDKSGDFIENVIEISVEVIASIFKAVVE